MHIQIEFSGLHGIQNQCCLMHQGRTFGYELQHLRGDPCFCDVMSVQGSTPLGLNHTNTASRNACDALVPCAEGNGEMLGVLHGTRKDMLDRCFLTQLEKGYGSHWILRGGLVNVAGLNLYDPLSHSLILEGQHLLFRTASKRVIHQLMGCAGRDRGGVRRL